VELYLTKLDFVVVPNTLFKFNGPKSILISRADDLTQLEAKCVRVLNSYLYQNGNKSDTVKKVKIWKHKTNNLEEIKELEKKHKNFTSVKIDAFALENEKVEDMQIEPDDILIVELQNAKGDWVFVPNEEP